MPKIPRRNHATDTSEAFGVMRFTWQRTERIAGWRGGVPKGADTTAKPKTYRDWLRTAGSGVRAYPVWLSLDFRTGLTSPPASPKRVRVATKKDN